MIEITHQNARRLIRQAVDHHLPEGQWAVLQAHLEGCAECRAYRGRLERQGKDLRRALRGGWEPLPGPGEDLARAVAQAWQRRSRRAQALGRAAWFAGGAAALVLLFFLMGGVEGLARLFQPGEPPAEGEPGYRPLVTEVALPPALPTAAAGEFPGVVIYEARGGGRPAADTEIYLLNPGAEPVNISSHPAEDTQPAWSPDGEWIAFLSNRQDAESSAVGEKAELFVTSLAGGRLVQLTAEPGIDWEGPLAWSPDGRSIALSGIRREQGRQRWVYLVPLDGTGPRAVVGTRGAWSPKFSRSGELLAYNYSDGDRGGLGITRLSGSGEQAAASWPENRLAAPPVQGAAFDWSPEGTALVYIGARPPASAGQGAGAAEAEPAGSEVVAVRNLNYSIAQVGVSTQKLRIASSAWPSAYRAVSWAPNGWVVYLEDLGDARARQGPVEVPGQCWQIQVRRLNIFRDDPAAVAGGSFTAGGLCVEGGLDSASWTADNRWLVVLGRIPGDSRRGIYAVRLPGRAAQTSAAPGGTPEAGQVLRLADDPFTGALPRVRPRAAAARLNIDPRPVSTLRADLPPSDLSARPGGPPGRLLYVVSNNNVNVVVATNPDGNGGLVLYASQAGTRCPRWSPDGRQVAVLLRPPAEPVSGVGPPAQDSARGGASDLPFQASPAPPAPKMGSVSGMPASRALGREELYLLDVESGASGAPRRVSNNDTLPESGPEPVQASYGCPVWSPDGAHLAVQISTGRSHYLAVLPAAGGDARYARTGAPVAGAGPVWSPDGRSLYLAQMPARGGTPLLMQARVPEGFRGALTVQTIPARADWHAIHGLAVAERSPYLTLLASAPTRYSRANAFVRMLRLPDESGQPWSERDPLLVGMNYILGAAQPGSLTWLPGEALGMVLYNDPNWRYKALLSYYDPTRSEVITLAAVEDRIGGLAWSPDGRWLVYSAESGLWGLDVSAARERRAAPVWLSPIPVQDLDWK